MPSQLSYLNPEKALIFRITHVQNLPWIFDNGLQARSSELCDPNFVSNGDPELIEKRKDRALPIEGHGMLSDYVPFYFTPFSPMLFNIRTGYRGIQKRPMRDIAILVTDVHRLVDRGVSFVLTDRHAYLHPEVVTWSTDATGLGHVDWPILRARDFSRSMDDPGKMDRYQAEALLRGPVALDAIRGVVCHGADQVEEIEHLRPAEADHLKVVQKREWYFA